MKAICVADIHGDMGALLKLRNSISTKGFESVFLLGDYSRGYKDEDENITDASSILEILKEFKVWAIPGNCDQRSIVELFKGRNASLHEAVLKLPEATFIGLGGSNVTPFNTPFEYGERQISQTLNSLHAKADTGSRVILLAHAPPKDTKCDVISSGAHVGSTGIREYIEAKQPDLVLCSHIHESGGAQDRIGKTRIVNLGRLSDGMAYSLSIGLAIALEIYTG